jgi:hypothetical protein
MNKYARETKALRYIARKEYERERKADEAWEMIILSGAMLFAVMLVVKMGGALI